MSFGDPPVERFFDLMDFQQFIGVCSHVLRLEVPKSWPLLKYGRCEYAPWSQQGIFSVADTRQRFRRDCAGCGFFRCVEGEGESSKAITMAVPVPFAGKSDVT